MRKAKSEQDFASMTTGKLLVDGIAIHLQDPG